jgi:hypothetical protein
MACSRGAASPDLHTQRRLFAASAGYCQNPGCANELFIDAAGKSIHIAEMAHVFAANDGGPRAIPHLSAEERGAFANLVMLCANCHTKVDKAPEAFPDAMMLRWKRDHAYRLRWAAKPSTTSSWLMATEAPQRDQDVVTYAAFNGLRSDVTSERFELGDLEVAVPRYEWHGNRGQVSHAA